MSKRKGRRAARRLNRLRELARGDMSAFRAVWRRTRVRDYYLREIWRSANKSSRRPTFVWVDLAMNELLTIGPEAFAAEAEHTYETLKHAAGQEVARAVNVKIYWNSRSGPDPARAPTSQSRPSSPRAAESNNYRSP